MARRRGWKRSSDVHSEVRWILAIVGMSLHCGPSPTGPAGASAPKSEARPSAPEARPPAAQAPSHGGGAPAGCEPLGPPERIEVAAGTWFTSASGLAVRHAGGSHDHYDDGHSELVLSLSLWDETQSTSWMPSVVAAPVAQAFFGRCVNVLEGHERVVVLSIAPARGAPDERLEPIAACGEATAPLLVDYASVKDGSAHHVEVERDPAHGTWLPVPTPRMPLHHASRLAWTNLVAHRGLTAFGGSRLRFTFEIERHDIAASSAGDRQWLASYFAKVHAICAP